jgi:hypothetical protein
MISKKVRMVLFVGLVSIAMTLYQYSSQMEMKGGDPLLAPSPPQLSKKPGADHPNEPLYLGYPKVGLELSFQSKPKVSLSKHKIALVFFGLVKSVSDAHMVALRDNVLSPLRELGSIDVFLHTFKEDSFSNPRNSEQNVLDQKGAIKKIRRAVSPRPLRVHIDDTLEAHRYFGPTLWYLRHGGAWKQHSLLSTHFYLRQQYSLLRATELWTGVNYSSSVQDDTNLPPISSRYSCVVYIRPDLFFDSPLPRDALRAMCRQSNDGQRDVVIPFIEFGGWNDRSAFGTPEGMALYGVRGMKLRQFIDAKQIPHAESYLARFLCENNVTVHLAPWSARRVRANGHLADFTAQVQLKRYYQNQTRLWYEFTRAAHENDHPLSNISSMNCMPKSMWSS